MAGKTEPRRDEPRTAADALDWLYEYGMQWWSDDAIKRDFAFHPSSFFAWIEEARKHFAIEVEAAGRHDPDAVRLDVERLAKAIEQSYPTTPNVEVDSDHEWYLMRAEGIAAEYERLARTATDGSSDE
jgi:hypothetical protein